MKKNEIQHHMYNDSEDGERQYLQKLKADRSMLQAVLNAFSQCYWSPFSLYSYSMFSPTDLLVKQPEDHVNKDCLKSRKTK